MRKMDFEKFTRRRSRKESRSLAAARASTSAENVKNNIVNEKDFAEVKFNLNRVRFQLFAKLIELPKKLSAFVSFVEVQVELFANLLSPNKL